MPSPSYLWFFSRNYSEHNKKIAQWHGHINIIVQLHLSCACYIFLQSDCSMALWTQKKKLTFSKVRKLPKYILIFKKLKPDIECLRRVLFLFFFYFRILGFGDGSWWNTLERQLQIIIATVQMTSVTHFSNFCLA